MTPQKVLIVEDELIVQMHLQRIVMAAGHQVTATTATGRGALRAADRDAPDLVLMDINLPGDLDGIDAARVLRDKHDCSVVFATAYADAETLDRTQDIAARLLRSAALPLLRALGLPRPSALPLPPERAAGPPLPSALQLPPLAPPSSAAAS